MMKRVPSVLIAGTNSGVGKTTLTAGIVGALLKRGLVVQPFKVGPDYIDPSYLATAAGRACRNLDTWMVPPDTMVELYRRAAATTDVAIVEGVMGLFDGRRGQGQVSSSADVAKRLGLPVLLVIDVGKMAQSAAAIALGYSMLDRDLDLAGVVVNNVGSTSHLQTVTDAVISATGLPVVGYMPKRAELRLPERHLGLVPASEAPMDDGFFARLVSQVEETIDLDLLLSIAQRAQPRPVVSSGTFPDLLRRDIATIAYAHDEAFSFYYQDNLDLLTAWGARLVPFSPLRDRALPAGAQGIYLGGGFPELYAADLAANLPLLQDIRRVHAGGMPIYAECGGLMYLCRELIDPEGGHHSMAGLVPAAAVMRGRHVALGYTEVRLRRNSFLLSAGEAARGHEFHWSSLAEPIADECAPYEISGSGRSEGYLEDNLLVSYVHLHFASNPRLAPNFVAACAIWPGEPNPLD